MNVVYNANAIQLLAKKLSYISISPSVPYERNTVNDVHLISLTGYFQNDGRQIIWPHQLAELNRRRKLLHEKKTPDKFLNAAKTTRDVSTKFRIRQIGALLVVFSLHLLMNQTRFPCYETTESCRKRYSCKNSCSEHLPDSRTAHESGLIASIF